MDLVVKKQHRCSYSGGKIACIRQHDFAVTLNSADISILSLLSGEILTNINGFGECLQTTTVPSNKLVRSSQDVDAIQTFDICRDEQHLAFYTRHGFVRVITIDCDPLAFRLTAECKPRAPQIANNASICNLLFDDSTILAAGCTDGSIIVWRHQDNTLSHTHTLTNNQNRFPVSCVQFYHSQQQSRLYYGTANGQLFAWNFRNRHGLSNRKHSPHCQHLSKKRSHRSGVLSIQFTCQQRFVLTISIQENICVWSTDDDHRQLIDIKLGFSVSCMTMHNEDLLLGDETGLLHLCNVAYDGDKKLVLNELGSHRISHYALTSVVPNDNSYLVSTLDCSIFLGAFGENYNWVSHKILFGFNDEILDIQSIKGTATTKLLIASNSAELKILDMDTFNCELCFGHSDTIMSIAVDSAQHLIATASKDKTVRFWRYQWQDESLSVDCVAVGSGHAANVNCVSCVCPNVFVSGGYGVLKLWDLSDYKPNVNAVSVTPLMSVVSHASDIMDIDISADKSYIISAGADHKLVLYRIDNSTTNLNISTVKEAAYHKGKTIWCVRFSPCDRICASGHNNGEIRVWSLQQSQLLQCLKVFQNKAESVLNLCFVNHGLQVIASNNAGMLKLFTLKSNECNGVYRNHYARIWALHQLESINKRELCLVTGGSDSVINVWRNEFAMQQKLELEHTHKTQSSKTEIRNCLKTGDFVNAVELCLQLNYKRQLLRVLMRIFRSESEKRKSEDIFQRVVENLAKDANLLGLLLALLNDWNTNSKYCQMCQSVLFIIFNTFDIEQLLLLTMCINNPNAQSVGTATQLFETGAGKKGDVSRKENVAILTSALLSYSNRHFNRTNSLLSELAVFDFVTDYY